MGTADASGGPWELVRLQGVTTRKEKALYFLSILPGRERKLPKPRLQYLFGKQGIWFELAEGTPPPHAPPPRPPPRLTHSPGSGWVLSQEACPASALQLLLPVTAPLSRPGLVTGSSSTAQREAGGREAPRAGGSFVPSGGGAPKSGRSQSRLIAAPPPQAGD